MEWKDYRPIITELRLQGWTVEPTTQGHMRAIPPDPKLGLVHFSRSPDVHATRNILRDLRKSGFVWPPLSKNEQAGARREAGATTPTSPPEEVPVASVIPAKKTAPEKRTMAQLGAAMDEARSYMVLAAEHRDECLRKVEAVRAEFEDRMRGVTGALNSAQKEYDAARAAIVEKRAAIDALSDEMCK